MCCDCFGDASLWHTGTTDDERDVDILLVATLFSGLEAVLTDVIAVIGRVKDVSVV